MRKKKMGENRRHILNIFSANSLQIVFSQGGGLVLFWLASKELDKDAFGDFNWYFAIYGTISAVLSFGLDFIVIKRISAINDLNAARLQFSISLLLASLSMPALWFAFSPYSNPGFHNSAFVMVAFQCTFLGMPFKNALTGKEFFDRTAAAVILSNSLKAVIMLVLWKQNAISFRNVSLVLAISNFLELIVYTANSWSVFGRKLVPHGTRLGDYASILRESLPQLGVIVFDSALARVDWILLGTLSSGDRSANTAEYSFAYKIFEMSRLPLLIFAPILFTRFAKLFYEPAAINSRMREGINSFFALGLAGGLLIPMLLNLIWVPVMQLLTDNKYGPENQPLYLLLSLTLPLLYMINFLWTMAFTQGQLKLTMLLSLINSGLNLLLNLVFIPRFGQTGSAFAYLACNVLAAPLYLYLTKQSLLQFPLRLFLLITSVAAGCYAIAWLTPLTRTLQCALAVLLFLLLLYFLKILTFTRLHSIKHFLKD